MANNGVAPPAYDIGALAQRVYATESGLRSVADSMAAGFADIRAQISGISKEFTDRSRVPWQALSVMMGATVVVGGLAYWPVREQQSDLRESIRDLAKIVKEVDDQTISRAEFNSRWLAYDERTKVLREQSSDRFKRAESDIDELRKGQVPRGEHEGHWRGTDRDIANLQRQVDTLKADLGGTFSLRDAIQQFQRRLDALESARRGSS